MTELAGPRRVGVLARPDRVAEALRTAAALPLTDNAVEVILLGDDLPHTAEIVLAVDTLELSEVPLLAAFRDPRVDTRPLAELAGRLRRYEHVITF